MRTFLLPFLLALVAALTAPRVGASVTTFDVNVGATSAATMDPIYASLGCAGIAAHMSANPIPVGAIDVANGKEIVGYEVICEGGVVAWGGTLAGSRRTVARTFGYIRLYYA